MRKCSFLIVLLMATGALAGEPARGLWVNERGILCKGDGPWRGIGVNYFNCFSRTLKDPADRSYERGFEALRRMRIPFARFMAGGFWPENMRLYMEDRARYFALLDEVVACARRNDVGLIPSLFWYFSTIPDLAGESCDQWGNPQSKTHGLMKQYVRDVVMRYRDEPAIWGWEFGNEYNLQADLPNAAQHRPGVIVTLGTPAKRTEKDDLTHAMVRTALREFAEEVRRHDGRRIIVSGNSFPRASAWHQMSEKSWKKDSPQQWARMLVEDNPDPVNMLTGRFYEAMDLGPVMETASKAGKPLFIGEFGVMGDGAEQRAQFTEKLRGIERHGVPLSAVWVYDYDDMEPQLNITATNARSWQLEEISRANARLRGE